MIHVLKLGGGAGIDYASVLHNLAGRIRNGESWVLVHGASDATNTLAQRLGYTVQTITSPGGHTSRYTDAQMIDIFSAAAASVNQQITALLAAYGVNAVGLAGPNVITARRKTAIRAIRDGRSVVIRDDYSGTITDIAVQEIRLFLDAGLTPVIAPVAMGEAFERLNVDGDLVAANVAHKLNAAALVILSNVPGLLRNVSDPSSLVHSFGLNEIDRYESLALGRMKKKLLAAMQAGVGRVILAGVDGEFPLDAALMGGGTHVIGEVLHVEYQS